MARLEELRIEYTAISEVRRWPRNPKKHRGDAIASSIARFGYLDPMLRDERSGQIVEGHGRLDELDRLRGAGKPAPKFVQVREGDGEWLVPVIRGVKFRTDAEAEAYLVAHNRTTEAGGWDEEGLVGLLRDLARDGVLDEGLPGYDADELADLLADPNAPAAGGAGGSNVGGGQDDVPPPPAEPVTREGDIWMLGAHRILCGDSMKAEDVDRLLAKKKPAMVLTDPPFAIYGSSTGIGADIADDKMVRPFFEAMCRQLVRVLPYFAHVYVHTDWRSWPALADSGARAGLTRKNCLVWDKGSSGLGSNYSNTYELVAFFARLHPPKAMASGQVRGQRTIHKSNLLRFPRVMGDEREHNAAKPVAMERELIENSSDPGDAVLDLFLGSGSTLIAAELAGRACYGMEMEPKWCDVVVRRWERATGRTATRQEAANG